VRVEVLVPGWNDGLGVARIRGEFWIVSVRDASPSALEIPQSTGLDLEMTNRCSLRQMLT
jgi:hypothetical protein